jgi:hypothetical protein
MSDETKPEGKAQADDYSVGYGKPPNHTKFKRGQSGNPTGRPKGSRSFKTLLNRELNSTIAVQQNGTSKKIRRKEALVKGLVNDALKGHDRPRDKVFDYIDRDEALETQAPSRTEIAERDAQILERYFKRKNGTGTS